ncbi:VOC family protein [Agrobacterium sp. rho-13.3]|uniref:VOC family protein n=1 Tax=Agrobacterium sp. rho-13.3 TaxID=3072980 RepID=UPI002A0EB924|nr:VOC family protein [Agrobacterium sp. rho-13.3]MDX8309155.1 VOC family protein [Agrobacterium sp. rho-13.3]
MSIEFGVDHLIVLVPDLEAARAAFVSAGFSATPLARHSEASGTANTCIMLPDTYIEIMGIVAETPASEGWQSLLDLGQGLRGIALRSTVIEETVAALSEKGFELEPFRRFSRTIPQGELRFSALRLPPGLTPGIQCIYCQHYTPELVWSADTLHHANGAKRIVAVTLPGSAALAALAGVDGHFLPVSEGQEGSLTIAFDRDVSTQALAAIHRETGLRIEPVAIS